MENKYRSLTDQEIELLKSNGNIAKDWSQIFVCNPFCVDRIKNSNFSGEVFLGVFNDSNIEDEGISMPEGIYFSRINSCTIGDHCAIHNVHYLSNYEIGDSVLLFNIDELVNIPNQLQYIEPMNECGGRKILPYNGMLIADAYLWAKFRNKSLLMQRLEEFTRKELASTYAIIGKGCVIKNCRTIRNVSINSSLEDPSRIVDCVVVSDGIVGYGCHLEYGCIVLRFLLGEHVKLERGVRLTDTVVGDNSTIACCEVGNNIIFPAHEQHHNNSFLIASLIMGQSNVAAGATIGSNHNGRTADNELVAGRGFWPGLCCSFKHSSKFASYCLLAKSDYPYELNIKLPFSLVNNNVSNDCLEIMPAYWWMYNMYALDRNSRKFAARDKRIYARQHIEFNSLAPDTIEEIIQARELLSEWINDANGGEVTARGIEKGKRKVVILKPKQAIVAYEEMLIYYAMQVLTESGQHFEMPILNTHSRVTKWYNLGGQLLNATELNQLIVDIENGELNSWKDIHNRYNQLWDLYPLRKSEHAYAVLCMLINKTQLDEKDWEDYCSKYQDICHYVAIQVKTTRDKDNLNPYRQMTYDNIDEMNAVLG